MRAFVLVVLSLVFFYYDRDLNCFPQVRSTVSSFTVSLQQAVNWPIDLVQSVGENLTNKQNLLQENKQLRTELLTTKVQLQRLSFLEQENSQLHFLLGSVKKIKSKFLVAQLFTLVVDNNRQINIDKGKLDGVYLGQPVIDAYGLFGQVTFVGSKSSKVLLLTDVKSAVPVVVVRNGLRTIAHGRGDALELVHVSETSDVKKGDSLVTSGIGKRFPAGYAVGVVKSVRRIPGERFMKIKLLPSAHIKSSKNVILVWVDSTKQLKNSKKK